MRRRRLWTASGCLVRGPLALKRSASLERTSWRTHDSRIDKLPDERVPARLRLIVTSRSAEVHGRRASSQQLRIRSAATGVHGLPVSGGTSARPPVVERLPDPPTCWR
jgi:hypothetical protein